MTGATVEARRPETYEEALPLIELCKAGRLFEVQAWIEEGKSANGPTLPAKGHRRKTPLEVAIDIGFHSLVKVLLEGGALIEPDGWDSPIYQALAKRRLDIVELLVEHGADPKDVSMTSVFQTWEPAIMEYFIERGADVETNGPFAWALSNRIRTVLGVFKKYRERFPSLPEQANIALRHHCKEGNLKWVSLLLWLGADPLKPGSDRYDQEPEDDDDPVSAISLAALYDHFDVFNLKQLKVDVAHPAMQRTLRYLNQAEGFDVLKRLLEKGLQPNDQENGGSSALQEWLARIDFDLSARPPAGTKLDTLRARDTMKAIHLLARHGAKWMPLDKQEIGDARRALLKLIPDYTVEFIWIVAKYKACRRGSAESLIGTPSMKAHIKNHWQRVQELIASL